MKIKSLSLILATIVLPFLLLLVSSCDKKEDNNNDKLPPRLKLVVDEQLLLPSSENTFDTTWFEYNNINQLTTIIEGYISLTGRLEYNTDGTLREMKMFTHDELLVNYNYSWSGNKITYTESDRPNFKVVCLMNPEKQVVRLDEYILEQEEWLMDRYTINYWLNDNLVSTETWRSVVYHSSSKAGKALFPLLSGIYIEPKSTMENRGDQKLDFLKVLSASYEYDDKINPYQEFQLLKFTDGHPLNSKNNTLITTNYLYNWDGTIADSSKEEYTYSYNEQNYPLVRNRVSELHPFKRHYHYE